MWLIVSEIYLERSKISQLFTLTIYNSLGRDVFQFVCWIIIVEIISRKLFIILHKNNSGRKMSEKRVHFIVDSFNAILIPFFSSSLREDIAFVRKKRNGEVTWSSYVGLINIRFVRETWRCVGTMKSNIKLGKLNGLYFKIHHL